MNPAAWAAWQASSIWAGVAPGVPKAMVSAMVALNRGVADVEHPMRCPAGGRVWVGWIKGRIGRSRLVKQANQALDDVVDIGEITHHLAVVEHLDWLACQHCLGEQKQSHIRPAPRPIHREKTQARGKPPVEVAVGVGHQLIGLLARRIEAHRMIHPLPLREGQVALDIGRRVFDRLAHPRLCGQVDHLPGLVLDECGLHCGAVLQVRLK
jgi:hypothetical protein